MSTNHAPQNTTQTDQQYYSLDIQVTKAELKALKDFAALLGYPRKQLEYATQRLISLALLERFALIQRQAAAVRYAEAEGFNPITTEHTERLLAAMLERQAKGVAA